MENENTECTGCGDCESCAGQCETCGKWPHGIGSNRCVCCTECGGQGSYSDERHLYRKCESCNGTGRAKAVAS